jgi:hypothetical protein
MVASYARIGSPLAGTADRLCPILVAPSPGVLTDAGVIPARAGGFGFAAQVYGGVSNQTLAGSEPDWNPTGHPDPRAGAPNMLLHGHDPG